MALTSRQQLKDYILRKLGSPVQQINVSDEQIEDRIDDALLYFVDYHYAGSEKSFYTHTMTQQDIDNKYITIPDNIIAITKLLPPSNYTDSFMSDRYQLMRNEFMLLQHSYTSLIPYYAAMHRIEDIDWLLEILPSVNFNRYENKVEFTSTGLGFYLPGEKIIFEVQAQIGPDQNPRIWDDRWLKQYATALVKRQWGQNLSAFNGIQLLGGITLNGQEIYEQADTEIKALEDEMIRKYSFIPLDEIA